MSENQLNYKIIAGARKQIIEAISNLAAEKNCSTGKAIDEFIELMRDGQLSDLLTNAVVAANARQRKNRNSKISRRTIYNWIASLKKGDGLGNGLRPKHSRNTVLRPSARENTASTKESYYFNMIWSIADRKFDGSADWAVREKLKHINEFDYTRSEKKFLAKVLFAELITRYCKWLDRPQSVVISDAVERLSKDLPAIDLDHIDQREFSEKILGELNEMWSGSEVHDWSRAQILHHSRYQQAAKKVGFITVKNYCLLHHATEYLDFLPLNSSGFDKILRGWIDEANVPDISDVPYGEKTYNVSQIASINRNINIDRVILSKNGIRKELKSNNKYMDKICSLMAGRKIDQDD